MIRAGNNDTSLIRSPVVRKAGRLDSYGGGASHRPVLVLQNNTGNLFCPTLIVAPLTTQVNKKKDQPTHYLLSGVRGLPEDSVALLEQIKTIDKSRVIGYLGKVSKEEMKGVDEALKISLGIYISEDAEVP